MTFNPFHLKSQNKKTPKIDTKQDKQNILKKETSMEDVENYYQQYSHYDLNKIIKFFKH